MFIIVVKKLHIQKIFQNKFAQVKIKYYLRLLLNFKPIIMGIIKWVHDVNNARVIDENDENCVFYTDKLTCDASTIDEVIRLHNIDSDGEIDDFLLYDKCTQDDREVIVEGIFNWVSINELNID